PAVGAAVVTAREDVPGDPRLVAYVLPRPGTAGVDLPAALRRHASSILPTYMVPSAVVLLDAFPLTPNGKVDRRALPSPADAAPPPTEVVAPQTPMEKRLTALWEEVLGMAPISTRVDFFDLGVSSVTAARLFARIEVELGARLPLGSLFRAPTIEALAAVLESGGDAERWTSLVPIQPQGDRPPLFCVHGGAGTILHLHALARRLGPRQPFYGLQMQGLYGAERPHRRVVDMADHYLAEVRQVQPHGPYRLGGYCFGGIVAYEMACRLVAEGEEVALLAMFNGAAPAYLRRHPEPISRRVPDRPPPPALKRRVRRLKERVRRAQMDLLAASGRPVPEHLRDRFFTRVCFRAERAYEPPPYPGVVTQFRSAGLFDEPLGWEGLAAGGVEEHEVPGEHLDQRQAMQEPLVGFVAERLAARLTAAGARDRGAAVVADG
ncbi:MAG: phosphopantetheine-binding protein, partial [Actinobacteria bacterium]|nr:phosphopantetheine-binding protein [Actinomycetota bacterium]